MIDRRRFYRVVFSSPAELKQGDRHWPTRLLDLSLQGALIERPALWQAATEPTSSELSFKLVGSDIEIHMTVDPCHVADDKLGLACKFIDIDSLSHLKRLIELNVGSDDMLKRDMAHLLEEHDTER